MSNSYFGTDRLHALSLSHTYSYNLGGGANNGNVASITDNVDTGRSQTFTYDTMNRLASAQSQATSGADCWGQSYGYDRYGNLTSTSVTQCSAPSLSLTVNGNNQITNTGVTYDAAGNMTNDGTQAYTWDGANRLKSAGGTANTFDGNFLRTARGPSELYWYKVASCGHELMGRSNGSGTYDDEFIYFAGKQIAYKDDTGGHVYYYVNDHLSSARVMTDASGVTQFDSDYYPFGGQRVVTNTVDSLLKFNGKQRDVTGVDNSFRRFYDSALGRWLSSDPVRGRVGEPQTDNLYGYVNDNPLNAIDPNGLFVIWICVHIHIPCPFRPNLQLCSYYDDLKINGDFCDKVYATAAGPACRGAGTRCFANCSRQCLRDQDLGCRKRFPTIFLCSLRTECRVQIHAQCFAACSPFAFLPRTFTICFPVFIDDDREPSFFGCGFFDPFCF